MTSVGDPEQATRTNSLLIPSIALGYVPFVIVVLMFYSHRSPDETLPGFEFLMFSSMCLVPLLPIYAFYLLKVIRQRRGNNTLTTCCDILHYFIHRPILLGTNVCLVCDQFQWDSVRASNPRWKTMPAHH